MNRRPFVARGVSEHSSNESPPSTQRYSEQPDIFPSQVPVFACQSRADIQWRLVELYFVHNWSCVELGERYNVAMERIRQLLSQWVHRAAVLGDLQEIPAATTLAGDPAVRHPMARPLPPAVIAPVPLLEPLVRTATASNAM